ncbi:MAG: hypothetical protein C0498_12380 [Anaerolinea sp.]|nr:hypothetical protein [Anaerolinea sp.]
MTVVPIAGADLPVIWWVFWLVVMAVGVFGAFAWWLVRAALREDSAPPADHEHDGLHGTPDESDTDGSGG